jgi:MYXO-CTERM domain-containing protein
MNRPRRAVLLSLLVASAALAGAEVRIVDGNGSGEGLNDPTPATPVGNNPGTTVGAQRRIAFQYAASLWAATLGNQVPIRVHAEFSALECSGGTAVLGSSGPTALYDDSRVPAALANEQAGHDLDPSQDEIEARFSSAVGTPGCAQGGWYYGLDNLAPTGATDLTSVVLHELAHGLGFIKSAGVFREKTLDDATQTLLAQLTDTAYQTAITTPMNVSWVGPEVRSQKSEYLLHTDGLLELPGDAGVFYLAQARFGPPPIDITAPLALARPEAAGGTPGDACGPLQPAPGHLLLADRGLRPDGGLICLVSQRALNAQAAGAVGLVIRHGQPGGVPVAYTGDAGPGLTIPVWGISKEDGLTVENYLAAGGSVVSVEAKGRRSGENVQGDVLLYTPTTFSDGSTLGHWDSSVVPALLMEPIINPQLSRDLDLTPAALQDLGWSPATGLAIGATKLDQGDLVAGEKPSYLIQVVNRGQGVATGVTVDVVADPSLVFDSAARGCPGGFPCSLGDLDPGEVRTLIATWAYRSRMPQQLSQTFRIVAGAPAPETRNAAITVVTNPPPGCSSAGGSPASGLALLLVALGLVAVRQPRRAASR